MQFPQGKPPIGIIFDSAMGSRIDDVLAMALMYGLDGKNEARVVSVSVSRSNVNSAAFSEAIGRFYAGAVSGDFGAVGTFELVTNALLPAQHQQVQFGPLVGGPEERLGGLCNTQDLLKRKTFPTGAVVRVRQQVGQAAQTHQGMQQSCIAEVDLGRLDLPFAQIFMPGL